MSPPTLTHLHTPILKFLPCSNPLCDPRQVTQYLEPSSFSALREGDTHTTHTHPGFSLTGGGDLMHCSCTPSAASKHFLLASHFSPLCHPHLCPVASLKPVALGARIGTTQGPTSRKPALGAHSLSCFRWQGKLSPLQLTPGTLKPAAK